MYQQKKQIYTASVQGENPESTITTSKIRNFYSISVDMSKKLAEAGKKIEAHHNS